MTTTVEARIRGLLDEGFGVDPDTGGSTPLTELGLDSLDEVEFTMNLEEEFDIEIDDLDVDKLTTIHKTAAYIEGRIHEK